MLTTLLVSNSILAAGVLDPNFGSNGKINFGFSGSTNNFARAAALQPDGKIVLAGTTGLYGQGAGFLNFAVVRLNPDGTLDNSFGSSGFVATDFNDNEDGATAIAIQPDGKIIIGGFRKTNQSFSSAFALARYNSDGSLDTTFNGGKVVTDFEESTGEAIEHLLIQTDGKIIAVGNYSGSFPNIPAQIALVRYNSNGTLDSGFGNNGKFTILFHRLSRLGGAAHQPDGKILITGYYFADIPGCIPTNGTNCEFNQAFLLRYHPQMTFDKKFGRKFGKEFTRLGFFDRLYDITLQSDGRILIVSEQVAKRYFANGRFDTVFDQAAFSNQNFKAHRLAQRPDGKIAGCGYIRAFGHDDIGLALFNPDGRLSGSGQQDFLGSDDGCGTILAQPDGKILLVGHARLAPQSSYNFAVARYLDITP